MVPLPSVVGTVETALGRWSVSLPAGGTALVYILAFCRWDSVGDPGKAVCALAFCRWDNRGDPGKAVCSGLGRVEH